MGSWAVGVADSVLSPFCFQKPFAAVCREQVLQCPIWEPLGMVALGMQREPFSPKGALLPALEQGRGVEPRTVVI